MIRGGETMEKIDSKQNLLLIIGGFSITGTIVNAFLSSAKFIYSLGQSLGSSIRRIGSKNICQL